ncbi:MAG: CidA/LrgA family protein [Treponema sp.]|nr:CidA/LrgA family protein [Treponema sp.]
MKFIKQFCILVTVCFIGEILHRLIPLPVPASIYGLVLMFALLQSKIMPLESVEYISDGLLSIMPLLFIPSTVGLILAWPILKLHWLQFTIIGVGSTIAVFFAAGHVTQLVIRIIKSVGKGNNNPQVSTAEDRL